MKLKIKSKKFKNRFIYADMEEGEEATSLVVFLSGLSGSKNLPLFDYASSEFIKNGFNTLRLNFYNYEYDKHKYTNALESNSISFSVYIEELKNVLDFVSNKYSSIVLIGHSFGAPIAIMFLSKYKKYASKTKIVIWDPSILPWKREWMEEDYVFNKDKKLYFNKHDSCEIINEVFYEECICVKNTTEILRLLNKKVCIIAAGKGGGEDSKKYFSKLRNKKSSMLVIIDDASHLFDGKNVQKELLNKTLEFLNR